MDGATIIRLKNYLFLNSKLQTLLNIPLFFNPIWLRMIFISVKKYKIDCIHVHDLPLAYAGILIGKMIKIPMVFDMHENYPEALRVWKKQGIEKIFKSVQLAKILEKWVLKQANRIVVVVDEQKENLLSKSVAPSKLTVISNTVDIEKIDQISINQKILHEYDPYYMILYIGSISRDRGLETPIQAMSIITKKITNAKLFLVGNGNHKMYLENFVKKHNLEKSVEFIEWVDFKFVPTYIKASKVCIIPQPANPFINTTIPHKLFQYMYLGKPVLVSDAKPLARIVTECQCGEIFKSNSPVDFADAIKRIHDSTINYGKKGQKAVKEKYNWNQSSQELIRLYSEL